jgi:hypothetical protein
MHPARIHIHTYIRAYAYYNGLMMLQAVDAVLDRHGYGAKMINNEDVPFYYNFDLPIDDGNHLFFILFL